MGASDVANTRANMPGGPGRWLWVGPASLGTTSARGSSLKATALCAWKN